MSHLNVILRNDYLRISIHDGHARANLLNAMHDEFVELLHSATFSEVVVVDLPSVDQLDSGLVSMLLTWHRIATLAGKQLRMNGISRVVNQVKQQMKSSTSGPHHRFAHLNKRPVASVS